MMQVWFLFKVIETCIGLAAMIFHILGFQNSEPLPHIMLFCGTFFGFTVVSLVGAIAILVGSPPPVFVEVVVNFFAAVLYILASIMSMYYAEHDFHLMYLSDFEEPHHPFFSFCRSQSICALVAGLFHLLHFLLATDVLISSKQKQRPHDDDSIGSDMNSLSNIDLKRPIRMYFLSKYIETKLRHMKWFDNMCRQYSQPLSVFSMENSKPSSKANTVSIASSRRAAKLDERRPPPSQVVEVDQSDSDEGATSVFMEKLILHASKTSINEKNDNPSPPTPPPPPVPSVQIEHKDSKMEKPTSTKTDKKSDIKSSSSEYMTADESIKENKHLQYDEKEKEHSKPKPPPPSE